MDISSTDLTTLIAMCAAAVAVFELSYRARRALTQYRTRDTRIERLFVNGT